MKSQPSQNILEGGASEYFVLDGNVCALLATKDHVNLFLYDPTVPDPHGLITAFDGPVVARRYRYCLPGGNG